METQELTLATVWVAVWVPSPHTVVGKFFPFLALLRLPEGPEIITQLASKWTESTVDPLEWVLAFFSSH